MQTEVENARESQIELVRRFGGATTDAILDPSCQFYQDPKIEGLIGYRLIQNYAVVFGDPVCSKNDLESLTSSFENYCKMNNLQTLYVIASPSFCKNILTKYGYSIFIEIGEVPYLDPMENPFDHTGTKGSLIRRKVRHATKDGVTVEEYTSFDRELEREIEKVGEAWLKKRQGPQIHISNIRLFEDKFGKRWFYAKHNNKIVGILLINQLQARSGWLMNRLMITSEAPHGTPELLVISALDKLREENCPFVSFGMIPLRSIKELSGLNPIATKIARFGYLTAARIYKLDGLRSFWGKFEPKSEPALLAFKKMNLPTLKALLVALNASIA